MTWNRALCELIEKRLGFWIDPDGAPDSLARFVHGRIEALCLDDPSAYVTFLDRQRTSDDELIQLTKIVTNGYTYFFRDALTLGSSDDLLEYAKARSPQRCLNVWSAGCSTGEEPYSLALLCAEKGIEAHILATDVNRAALRAARRARYSSWSLRHVPGYLLERYFKSHDRHFELVEPVRRSVTFQWQNLVEDEPLRPPEPHRRWDLVFCQNVLVHCRQGIQEKVIRCLARRLRKDGLLVLGATERIFGLDVPVQPMQLGAVFAYTPHYLHHRGNLSKARTNKQPLTPPGETAGAPEDFAGYPSDSSRAGDCETSICVTPPPTATNAHLAQDGRGEGDGAAEAAEPEDRPVDESISYVTQGNLLLSQHAFERALRAYARAQECNPLLAEVHYFQGLAYRKLGDFESAKQALMRALFLEPDHWPAAFLLAGVFERQQKQLFSRRELHRALSSLNAGRPLIFRSNTCGLTTDLSSTEEVKIFCRQKLLRYGHHRGGDTTSSGAEGAYS